MGGHAPSEHATKLMISAEEWFIPTGFQLPSHIMDYH